MGALLACGALADARRTLEYLRVIQEADGHWPQNTWLDGTAYWGGTQLDETAFPVLLVDLAFRHGALPEQELLEYWPMVRRACAFIICNGPSTGQDRWEENAGYSPATIAVEIAALLAAADFADRMHARKIARFLRETADAWNADLETWIYVTGTELAKQCKVAGYYLRISGEGDHDLSAVPVHGRIAVRNRPANEAEIATDELVGADALALVRFGLRTAKDPRILDTITVIDHLTRVDLPQGPAWHRYNNDGYGEHNDGRPFDGTGHGRAWPLLTGERAHYAIAADDMAEAERLRETIEGCASEGGLLPEQVWDAADRRALSPGVQPAGIVVFWRTLTGATVGIVSAAVAQRLGHAARLGPCRVYQAAALAPGRRDFRPAAANRATLSGRENPAALPRLAGELAAKPDAGRANLKGRTGQFRHRPLER